jgi:hypothetical protein
MVRLLGRISDKRVFFEDSKTIIDHGTTLSIGQLTPADVATHFKSIIWGWAKARTAPSASWFSATGGNAFVLNTSAALNATIDWFAIGYTA